MTEYIKVGSDRPNFHTILREPDGTPVELTDATSVTFLMWDPDANLLINDTGTILDPYDGEVEYDFDDTQIASVGTNEIEVRVDYDDGDRQWFPIHYGAYELEVTRSPSDREASLTDVDPAEDATVNRLTVHDAVESDTTPLTLDDSVQVNGDLSVSGSIAIAEQSLADGETITYGTDGDFTVGYQPGPDAWVVADALAPVDALRLARGGSGTVDIEVGDGTSTLYDHGNDRVGADLVDATSLALGITPTWTGLHRFDAGVDTRGDVVHDALTVYDAANQEISEDVLPSAATGDEHTVNSGHGLLGGATLSGTDSLTLNVEPADFAGTGLEDDGTDNLQIQSGGVGTTQLASGAVTTTELAPDAVTAAEIATDAVASDEIAANAINDTEIDLSASYTWSGIHDHTGTLQYNGTEVATTDDTSGGTSAADIVVDAPNLHFNQSAIPSGDFLAQRVAVPDGMEIIVYVWGGQLSDGSALPSNVSLNFADESSSTFVATTQATYEQPSTPPSLSNSSGSSINARFEINNGTGSQIDASGFVGYTLTTV